MDSSFTTLTKLDNGYQISVTAGFEVGPRDQGGYTEEDVCMEFLLNKEE